MPALGLVNPITEQVDPEFQVAIGKPKPANDTPAMAALHSYVPPLLKVRVVVLAPVMGVVLASAERRNPLIELVAPVTVSALVPISNRALALIVSKLLTVNAAPAVTSAAVFDMVRFRKVAALVKMLCAVVPLKFTVLPVVVVAPAVGV